MGATRYYGLEAAKARAAGDYDECARLLMEGSQHYTNEILGLLGNGVPEPNAPCVIFALETTAKILRDQCPFAGGAADDMARMFGARAITMRRVMPK